MVTRESIEALWFTDKSNDELGRILGLSRHQLWMAKRRYGLPKRHAGPLPSDPDEETIAAKCLEIQAAWTPAVRESRRRNLAGVR